MSARDQETAEVWVPGEAAEGLAQTRVPVEELIVRGIEILLQGAGDEDSKTEDPQTHLVRTRAMYWAILSEAVEKRRALVSLQAERAQELADAPALEREYRELQERRRPR